jgi:hypothetical protein
VAAYQSAEALLADADLRLDRFGESFGLLVVEGPDDKRLFCSHTLHRQQVIGAGGRRLLLSALAFADQHGRNDVLFVTDCDYEVALGRLHPSANLVITEQCDVESDLVALGGVERIVLELVPDTLESDDTLNHVVNAVLTRSVSLAQNLGALRKMAVQHGFEISTDVRFGKFRTDESADVDDEKMVRSVLQGTDCPLDLGAALETVRRERCGLTICNGHDLMGAINHVLRADFGVRDQTPESLEALLRHGLQRETFSEWSVVVRIRRWEEVTGRRVLA